MKEHPAILYVVEFRRAGEEFLKVGITRTAVKSRLKSGYRKYTWTTVVSETVTLFEAFGLEQQLLAAFKQFQTFPKQNKFCGKTECLSPSCRDEVLRWLQSKSGTGDSSES